MSVAVNYYLYLQRGEGFGPGNVTASTSSGGTNGDIELRIQIDNGTGLTGVTRMDVKLAVEQFLAYMLSNWPPALNPGTNLPKL